MTANKKKARTYLLDFLIILLGISTSFFLENKREQHYQKDLKEQSLSRMIKNIQTDQKDYDLNIKAHQMALQSSNWLTDNKATIQTNSRDSIGYHLQMPTGINTLFIDNDEEYRSLQNSGLIELIKNEHLVEALQNKYSSHEYIDEIENMLGVKLLNLDEFRLNNIKHNSNTSNQLGFVHDISYAGPLNLPSSVIQKIYDKMTLHQSFIDVTNFKKKTDEES
jgi:hypothetical protein